MTLVCPEAVQRDSDASWEIEARDASSRIGNDGMISVINDK